MIPEQKKKCKSVHHSRAREIELDCGAKKKRCKSVHRSRQLTVITTAVIAFKYIDNNHVASSNDETDKVCIHM